MRDSIGLAYILIIVLGKIYSLRLAIGREGQGAAAGYVMFWQHLGQGDLWRVWSAAQYFAYTSKVTPLERMAKELGRACNALRSCNILDRKRLSRV